MAPEQQANGSTPETGDQEQQGQQQQATPETGGNGSQQQAAPQVDDSTQLPDTHPLVKAYATQKQAIAAGKTELAEARAKAAQVTSLEEQLNSRPTQEAFDTLQKRYDRLEAFLQQAGGDLGSALDSRTFTRQLFETEDKVEDIVKAWNKAHPSATSKALGGTAGQQGEGKQDPNKLIRAAWNGGSDN